MIRLDQEESPLLNISLVSFDQVPPSRRAGHPPIADDLSPQYSATPSPGFSIECAREGVFSRSKPFRNPCLAQPFPPGLSPSG